MDSKTYNTILGRVFNIVVILTFLISLAVSVGNTIYFKKLYDDNGSKSITADTANAFYGVNLAIAVLTLIVLIMYFFKRIVLTIWFMIILVLLVTGIIGMTISSTIYFKKLWDDGGSTSVSSETAKNMFFFNLTVAITSLIVFLIFLYRWYELYNLENSAFKINRGYDINTRELTEEERIETINREVLNAIKPKTQLRNRFSRSTRGYAPLTPIYEEDEEFYMETDRANMMSPTRMQSPYMVSPDVGRNVFTPSRLDTSIRKDRIQCVSPKRLDFEIQRDDEMNATYTAGSFSSYDEDLYEDSE